MSQENDNHKTVFDCFKNGYSYSNFSPKKMKRLPPFEINTPEDRQKRIEQLRGRLERGEELFQERRWDCSE